MKLAYQIAYPPRAMRAEAAAAYLSMSKAMFLRLVEDGLMPQPTPVRSMVTWDRNDLDDAYQAIKDHALPAENSFDKNQRERKNAKTRKPTEKV